MLAAEVPTRIASGPGAPTAEELAHNRSAGFSLPISKDRSPVVEADRFEIGLRDFNTQAWQDSVPQVGMQRILIFNPPTRSYGKRLH